MQNANQPAKTKFRRGFSRAAWAFGLSLAWLFAPVNLRKLTSQPRPTATYAEAEARFKINFANSETSGILPAAVSRFFGHGQKTKKAFLLIHGLTNCPAQFEKIAQQLYQQGYNVIIPRMPKHGLADQMSGAMKEITAELLCEYADQATDILAGLGDELVVIGLSGGAVVAAWIAQNRHEVSRVVTLAPALGVINPYTFANYPLMSACLRLPNFYTVRTLENRQQSAPYVHFKRASYAAANFMRLGLAVRQAALQETPAARQIVVVSNAADTVVNNGLIYRLTSIWQNKAPHKIKTYQFEVSLKLPHDLIDPIYKLQRTEFVYPIVLKLALEDW